MRLYIIHNLWTPVLREGSMQELVSGSGSESERQDVRDSVLMQVG